MKYTGRCACGQVRLSISGEALAVRQCWCRQCQYVTGGGAAHNAMFRTADVAIDGALGSRSYAADSGNTVTQWFCPTCATPVYVQSSARPHFRTVRLGVLDQPHDLAPRMVIWTRMAPPWARFDPALEHYEAQPPAPQSPATS
ncbi:MAG: GFA family protein [Pseudomonadota bacterium]|jgi:hypothetical protein|nr:MAG: aldehyde-activating protein [Pseudomonadota bacterium]